MDGPPSPVMDRLRDRLGAEALAARLAELGEAFGGLLDEEALALLLLDELGLNEGAFVTLDQLGDRQEATVRAVVDRVEAPREFPRQGRPPGRVCNVAVSDATGSARLVLWDRDVEKAEDGTLRPAARLTVVNARVKHSSWGTELHVSPWSVLEVEGALDPAKRKLLQDVAAEPGEVAAPRAQGRIVGTLLGFTPTRTYPKEGGGVGFVCEVDLDTLSGRVRATLWDEAVREARRLPASSRVALEGFVAKPRGAQTEWHSAPGSRVVPT